MNRSIIVGAVAVAGLALLPPAATAAGQTLLIENVTLLSPEAPRVRRLM